MWLQERPQSQPATQRQSGYLNPVFPGVQERGSGCPFESPFQKESALFPNTGYLSTRSVPGGEAASLNLSSFRRVFYNIAPQYYIFVESLSFHQWTPHSNMCPGLMILPCCLLGQLVFPVQVQERPGTLYPSVFDAGITIHTVAASAYPACG